MARISSDSRHILAKWPSLPGAWVEHSETYYEAAIVLVWQRKAPRRQPRRHDAAACWHQIRQSSTAMSWAKPSNGKSLGEKIRRALPLHRRAGRIEGCQIARSGRDRLYIVEGEIDVWSMRALDIPQHRRHLQRIGHYPETISLPFWTSWAPRRAVYLADNDQSRRALAPAKLRGAAAFKRAGGARRNFARLPARACRTKGDVNDLLLPPPPRIWRRPAPPWTRCPRCSCALRARRRPAYRSRAATTIRAGTRSKKPSAARWALPTTTAKASARNIFAVPIRSTRTPAPAPTGTGTASVTASAAAKTSTPKKWRSFCTSPGATLLGGAAAKPARGQAIDLNAAPRQPEASSAPPFGNEPPDNLLRLSNRYYSTMHSALYYTAARLRSANLLPEAFSVQEFVDAAPMVGCELKERAIYDNFEEARHGDDHPFFAKI